MFKPRPYQTDRINNALNQIKKVNKHMIVAPTGAGKTVIATYIIKNLIDNGKRLMFAVANTELVMQSYNTFSQNFIQCGVIKAGLEKYQNHHAPCQIVMMQSYSARKEKLPDLAPDIIIVDEVDFGYKGDRLKSLLEQYPNIKMIGLTATPIDDKGNLLKGFDSIDDELTPLLLIQQGFLSRERYIQPTQFDLSNVKINKMGEFVESELDEACNKDYIIADVVSSYKKMYEGNKFICFANSINHAELLQADFLKQGLNTMIIHSKMKKSDIKSTYKHHQNGYIKGLINVGMVTRGYDDVDVIDIVNCRATMSEALYRQMIGRAARLDKKGLHYFRHFDYAGNAERFGYWSSPRKYSEKLDREKEVDPIICPNCKEIIFEKVKFCPYCHYELIAEIKKQDAKRKEIEEKNKVTQVVEIEIKMGLEPVINILNNFGDGTTFYYNKLFKYKPASSKCPESFYNEIKLLAKKVIRQGYKPDYIVFKIKEKFACPLGR